MSYKFIWTLIIFKLTIESPIDVILTYIEVEEYWMLRQFVKHDYRCTIHKYGNRKIWYSGGKFNFKKEK